MLLPFRGTPWRGLRLQRERIYLRPPRQGDWKAWTAVRAESREFLEPWEPSWSSDTLTRPAFRRLLFFMGDERFASGSLFIPDSSYFVGLFLCHGDDRINHPYVGSYFKKSGRYVCGDRSEDGQLVTTRFDLLEAYRNYFDKEMDDDPAISGIAVALDTKKAGDGGRSTAFIREIRFYR